MTQTTIAVASPRHKTTLREGPGRPTTVEKGHAGSSSTLPSVQHSRPASGGHCPQFLQLSFESAALVAMVNLPMVRRAQARRVLDAVFPTFGEWDHVVDFTVRQAVSRQELPVIAAWHLTPMSGALANNGNDQGVTLVHASGR